LGEFSRGGKHICSRFFRHVRLKIHLERDPCAGPPKLLPKPRSGHQHGAIRSNVFAWYGAELEEEKELCKDAWPYLSKTTGYVGNQCAMPPGRSNEPQLEIKEMFAESALAGKLLMNQTLEIDD
jgi:hypothetical protein